MDLIGAFIRITGEHNPRWGARLSWLRDRRAGDFSLRVVETLVRRGDVVVDIGAHKGIYACRLERLVGPRGHVHVIEPNPENVARLEAIRGRRTTMTVYATALSDQTGEARLHIPVVAGRSVSALASLAVPSARDGVEHAVVPVTLRRLDDILPADGPPVAFIKCDVEGHEPAVLRGAEATLRRSLPALLIEIEQRHRADDIGETFAFLAHLGYDGYAVFTDGLRPLDEFDVARDQLAYLGDQFIAGAMPHGYVHDFVFVRPGTDLGALAAPGRRRLVRAGAGAR